MKRIGTIQIQHFESNVDLASEDKKNIHEDIDSISREDDHKSLIEDASGGYKVRSKGDKLSVDQSNFIRT